MRKLLGSLILCSALLWMGCSDDSEPQVLPTISIADASANEGDNTNAMSFTITVSGDNATNIIGSFGTVGGTASPGIDFASESNGEFIINPGVKSVTIDVVIKGEEIAEDDETFEVKLLNVSNATIERGTATGTIINDDGSGVNTGVTIPTTGYSSPDNYAGMSLVWQDEFDGPTVNTNDWTFEIGNGNSGWGNNELQYYRQENAEILDGNLVITAKEEPFNGYNYTSTRMKTQGKKFFKYGRVDIRAAMPEGQGVWPALWMLGENFSTVGWPSCGEIDILEIVGHDPDRYFGTIHWEENGHASYGGNSKGSIDLSEEFNVYSIIWDDQSIRWLFNDTQYHVADITPGGLTEFHEDFFFIFNIAVGGNWPGSPDASTVFDQYMIVDYIRVFQ